MAGYLVYRPPETDGWKVASVGGVLVNGTSSSEAVTNAVSLLTSIFGPLATYARNWRTTQVSTGDFTASLYGSVMLGDFLIAGSRIPGSGSGVPVLPYIPVVPAP